MKLKNRVSIGIFLIGFITILNSCYKHEEGCRDLNALNYDVVADNDCEDNCCRYPKVSINFEIFNDTVTIDTNTYFTNGFEDSIRIKLLRMYFSAFSLTDSDEERHDLYNRITIGTGVDSIPEYKNINYSSIKVNEKGGKFDIGTLDKLSTYNKIEFTFGIDSLVNHSAINKITSSSYLYQFSDSMYIDRVEGYYFLKLNIEIKNKGNKSITIKGDQNIKYLKLNGDIDFTARENHTLPVKLDLKKWFKNIDFVNKNNDELAKSLISTLNSSLEVN